MRPNFLCYLGLMLLLVGSGCRSSAPLASHSAAAASGHFTGVTAVSGLAAFQHTDGSSGRRFFVEQTGSGCAFLDYDNDGWLDVYFCNGAPLPGYRGPRPGNALFHNNRDGTFTDVTSAAGVGCGRYSVGCAA